MGYCKKIQLDCFYTDRDTDDACFLNECKYMLEITYRPDGSFTTKPVKTKKRKNKKADKNNG